MIDADDLELFEQSLRHANESHTGAALDTALVELGWHDALAVDPRAAIATHFERQGFAGATSSALDHVVGKALHFEAPMAVVFPGLGRWAPPGVLDHERDRNLVIDGIGASRLTEHDGVIVGWTDRDGTFAGIVPTPALTVHPEDGIDPELGLARVSGAMAVPGEGAPVDWSTAVDLARIALAHELTGAGRAMLDLAREHALDRKQFGQPIAGFQAVRHRLSEALVAIEMSAAALDAAWIDGTSQSAAMAKAVAGRSARTVAKHCQQVLAGIGFTKEHPFHGYLRRVLVLDEVFGAGRALTRSLGSDVLERGQLPPLVPL